MESYGESAGPSANEGESRYDESGILEAHDATLEVANVERELAAIEAELRAVEAALGQLDERSFGECEICGAAIDLTMFADAPLVRRCAAHR